MTICRGCGIALTDKEDELGYCHAKNKDNLCQRCYELINFNKSPTLTLSNEHYLAIMKSIAAEKGYVLWVVDVLDLSSSTPKLIPDILQDCKIILVLNKVDLLPKSTNLEKLITWVERNLNYPQIVGNIIVSAEKNYNIDLLLELLASLQVSHVYLVGVANTGKSSLINKLVGAVTGTRSNVVTTSYYPGTTLGKLAIQVTDELTVYDTPGLINNQQITNYLGTSSLKKITPKKELKAVTYQLNSQQVLFISGLVIFKYVKGPKISVTIYVANSLPIQRTKLENYEQFKDRHLTTLMEVPTWKELNEIGEYKRVKFKLRGDQDIVLNGLGYIAIKGVRNSVIEVEVPEFMQPEQRDNLL